MISKSLSKSVLLLFILCISSFSTSIFAQTIKATTSASDVFAMQPFDVIYTINGTRNAQLVPPDFSPFRVTAGPFQSSNVQIINGRKSESLSVTYRLTIDKPGNYTIPKATMKTGSYSKKSNSLKIKVVEPSKNNQMQGNNIFLDMTLSDSIVYVGQQLLIDHDVYFGSLDVKGSSLIGEFPRDRFLINAIFSGDRITKTQMMYEGKMRNKAKISRLALFPLRSGEISIPDINFQVDLANPNARRTSFFFRNYDQKNVRTPGFVLDVKPLPIDAPKSFTGCVGNLVGTSELSKGPFSVGQEILVNFELRGTGISDQVTAPTWKQSGLEIYDAKLLSDNRAIENGQIVFTKVFQYLVIPQENGEMRLEIPYAFFDPASAKYIEKVSSSVKLNVNAGSTELVDALDKNIQGEGPEVILPLYKKPWFYGLMALMIAGIVFFFSRKGEKSKEPEFSVEEAALIVAKRKLSSAKDLLDSGNTGEYWETLENGLRIYLEEKLEIGTTDYSITEISQRWTKANFKPVLLDQWKGMVDKINLARYAGQSISDMENLYKEALDWIVASEL